MKDISDHIIMKGLCHVYARVVNTVVMQNDTKKSIAVRVECDGERMVIHILGSVGETV